MSPRPWVRALAAHPRHLALAGLVCGLVLGPRAAGAVPWVALGPLLLAVLALTAPGAVRRVPDRRPMLSPAGAAIGERSARAGRGRPETPSAAVRTTTARCATGLALFAVLVPGGAWVAGARLAALDRTALGPLLGHAARVRAVVLQPPRGRSFGRSIVLVGLPGGERVAVQAAGALRVEAGEEVAVRGGWRALPAFEAALRRAGAHALIRAEAVVPTGRRRGGLLGVVDGVRRRAEAALSHGLPPPLAGLARGMVLGQDEGLSEATREDFRASGLAHLVAASGANVALLATLALALGALLGVPWAPRLALALVLVAGYVPLAGGGPSIQRAGIMGGATLVAALASQPAARWYALLLAGTLTLALNPRAAEDPGWQLSFAAVIGLLALARPLARALARRLPGALAEALAVVLAASAATAPLIALHFGRLSWVTLPANLLAAPAVAPIMWLGACAAAVGQLAPALAAPLTALAAWPLAFVAWVGHGAARLPGADAEVSVRTAVAVAGLVPLALGLTRRRRRHGRPSRRGRTASLAAVAALVAVTALTLPRAAPPPAGLTVAALDVGQGDATLIRDGPHAVLVDTGPPGGPILRRLDEAGVDRLDLLVVTHAQADHQGGAAAVLGELPVGLVLDGRDGVESADGDAWAAQAARRGVRLLAPAAGQRLRVGPIVLDVLSPRPAPRASRAGEDPNDRAIVARLRDGPFSMLLTADAESDVLRGLPLAPVDLLKVAHHGSDDPGLPALLARLRPRTALIEVGRRNRYGHPAPSTLAALRGVEVRRTDAEGTVVLRP